MKRSNRKTIAQETVRIIEAGGYRSPGGRWVELQEMIESSESATVCSSQQETAQAFQSQLAPVTSG